MGRLTLTRIYLLILAIAALAIALAVAVGALISQLIAWSIASGAGVWLGGAALVAVAAVVVAGRRGSRACDQDFETEARRAFRRDR